MPRFELAPISIENRAQTERLLSIKAERPFNGRKSWAADGGLINFVSSRCRFERLSTKSGVKTKL